MDGSQVPSLSTRYVSDPLMDRRGDPRVGPIATTGSGVASVTKISGMGKNTAAHWSAHRKRL